MKKILALALALIMLLSVAALVHADEGVTITYMASQDWVQDAEMELAEKFTEKTGIKVDFQIIPSDQYTTLLMSKLNAGECADLFGSQAGQFDIVTQLNVEKNAVDLSGEAWASTVDPLAASETSVNGKLYGQPAQDVSAVWAVAYNKKVFEKLNLSVPTNYEEFKAVCEAIKADGMTPIYEAVSDGWHHQLWFCEMGVAIEHAEPGTAEKLNNNTMKFADSAAAKQLIEQIKEMADLGYWGDNYMANAYADAAKAIAEGECAMTVANQGFPTELNAAYPEFAAEDIGFFVMPLCDNQVLNMNRQDRRREAVPGLPRRAGKHSVPDRESSEVQHPALHDGEGCLLPRNLRFLCGLSGPWHRVPDLCQVCQSPVDGNRQGTGRRHPG